MPIAPPSFSADFSAANPIYDPLTSRTVGSTVVRDRFPGDTIPSNRWDPVTAKLINAYPLPVSSGLLNNYVANLSQTQSWNQGDVRVDHAARGPIP